MSYPYQQRRGYGMPMPQQYSSQYPGYGAQPARQPYPSSGYQNNQPQPARPPYPSPGTQPVRGGYPSSSYQSNPQQPPYPTATSQLPYPSNASSNTTPYPTTGVKSMNLSNHSSTTSDIERLAESSTKSMLALIKDAPKSELEQFINNEDRIIELVQDTEEVKKLQKMREDLIAENKDLAVTNLSMEPEITQLREELTRLAQQQNILKETYVKHQSEISGKISLDGMLAVLQAETSQSDSDSEKISEEFISSDEASENIDLFMETYINKRIEYQLRKVKAEKMASLVTASQAPFRQNAYQPAMPSRQPIPAPRLPPNSYY